jgi:AAA+ ATPase superfamily predicted ATPase
MTEKKKSSSTNSKNNDTQALSHQMGHILYMAQLTGNLDKSDLIDSMPKHEQERYKKAFEYLVEEGILQVLNRGSHQFFSINPEKIKDADPFVSGFVRGTKREKRVVHAAKNPFFHRGPIKDIKHFFGRGDEITHIFDRLRHTEDCSIIGPRAIGKTSLLHYIAYPDIVRKHHLDPKKYIFVYCDLQRFGENADVMDFYFEMFQRLVVTVNQGEHLKEGELKRITKGANGIMKKINKTLFEIADLEALITSLSEKDYRIVFQFDEFENISSNPNFDFSFYGHLRSLSGNPTFQVSLMTASKHSIYDLTFDEEIKTSPFFRYFEDFRIGPMGQKEIGEFYDLASKNNCAFSSQIKDLIEEWSGGHPFLVQLACDYFFDLVAGGGKFAATDSKKHLEIFLKRHKKHFAYFWSQVNKREQACLWWLASGKHPGSDCDSILSELEEDYLVVTSGGKSKIFSTAFERFIQDIPFFG